MVQLRHYQSDAVERIMASLRMRKRVMYTLPTGGGKTVIGTEVAARWIARNAVSRVIWLTHRIELERQSTAILKARGIPAHRMMVTSPLKMLNALERGEVRYGRFDLLLLDEAHHATARTWAAVITRFPGAVLGLSATPWRLSVQEGFDHLYDELILGPTKQDLIKEGNIVHTLLKRPPKARQVIEGRGSNGAGDYSTSDTMDQSRLVLVERGIDWLIKWNHLRGPLRTIAYCLNVQHAESVCDYARTRWNLRAATLHSQMPLDQRDAAFENFAEGNLDLLLNVAVVTEGNDVPGANCILMLRPTQSLALWLQMCGRASRPAPEKDAALVLDATTNALRLGHPDDTHEWSLKPRGSKKAGRSQMVARTCSECGTTCSSSVKECPDCGFRFGVDCPRCGWSFGFLHDGIFVVPNLDPDTGACFRCTVVEQDSLFGDNVLNFTAFRKSFRVNEDGKLTFYDHEMNITYWIGEDRFATEGYIGGVFLSDRAARRYMEPKAYRETNGSIKALFDGNLYARGGTPREVQREMYDTVYRPITDGLKKTLHAIENGLDIPLFVN